MIVLVPSRGRPKRAASMATSARNTAEGPVRIVIAIDPDDDIAGYRLRCKDVVVLPERLGYTGTLNRLAREHWDEHDILGAFGDDVQFLTRGWDRIITDTLATPGIAYGNDLVHAAGHPTAIWMSSVIAKALGYLAIPQSRHLWVDDAWKELGLRTGTLRYVPEVIVEHMHPAVGKADMDATYHDVYDGVKGHNDHLGFMDWQANHSDADVAKVKAAIGA